METTIDRAESAISYFAIILPIIDRDYSGVELEALDNRKIDAVFVQIVGSLRSFQMNRLLSMTLI